MLLVHTFSFKYLRYFMNSKVQNITSVLVLYNFYDFKANLSRVGCDLIKGSYPNSLIHIWKMNLHTAVARTGCNYREKLLSV